MTLATTVPLIDYVENGVTASHPVPFQFDAATDLLVSRILAGIETVLVLGSGYTVAGGSGSTGTVMKSTGGTLGATLRIRRRTSRAQPTDYTPGDAFPAESHEDGLDRAFACIQEQDAAIGENQGRSLRFMSGQTTPELNRAAFAGKYFAGDGDGNPIPSSGTGNDPALRADLAQNNGFTLIKHKRAEAATYARTAAQLNLVRAFDSRGISVFHWIDPALDELILAGTNVTDLAPFIQNAHNQLPAGRQQLDFAPVTYKLDTPRFGDREPVVDFTRDDLVICAHGANFVTSMVTLDPLFRLHGNRIIWRGGRILLTGASESPWALEVTGQRARLSEALLLEKTDGIGGYQMYVRHTATGFAMFECGTAGSNGIFHEASDAAYMHNSFRGRAIGGDDAIAIKAIQGFTRRIRVIGNYFENLAALCSIGSEVGTLGANDPGRSRGVGQVLVTGNNAQNCYGLLFIKPGAIDNALAPEAYDWRDGTVEDVVCSNNTLTDDTGFKCDRAVTISAGRGAEVRGVRGVNNVVRARSTGGPGRRVAAVDVYIPDLTAVSPGINEPVIRDVDLQVSFEDPYEGQITHASRPGHPFTYIAAVQSQTMGHGKFENIRLDIHGNGSHESGVLVAAAAADIDDQVRLKLNLKNYNRGAHGGQGGVVSHVKVKIDPETLLEKKNGSGDPYILTGAAAGFSCDELVRETFHHGAIAALAGDTQRPLTAPKRALLVKLELKSATAIAASDVDFTTIRLRNPSGSAGGGGGGADFHTPKSKATGATEMAPNFALAAHVWSTLLDYRTLTNAANMAQCLFGRDTDLEVVKDDAGGAAGRALSQSRLRAHWVPY